MWLCFYKEEEKKQKGGGFCAFGFLLSNHRAVANEFIFLLLNQIDNAISSWLKNWTLGGKALSIGIFTKNDHLNEDLAFD